MDIETKTASIDTIAVTIQALRVNNKQMTLSVFKQLPVVIAYMENGELFPMTYWGRVRYSIKDQGSEWVVANHNNLLYRCLIYPDFDPVERSELYLDAAEKQLIQYRNHPSAMQEYDAKYEVMIKTRIGRVDLPESSSWYKPGEEAKYINNIAEAKQNLRLSIVVQASYDELRALPQLFIAV